MIHDDKKNNLNVDTTVSTRCILFTFRSTIMKYTEKTIEEGLEFHKLVKDQAFVKIDTCAPTSKFTFNLF